MLTATTAARSGWHVSGREGLVSWKENWRRGPSMRIAEIFYSVQGEGILVGVPSAFVRTSGCPLRCTWCDSPYTSWEPSGETMSVEQVVVRLAEYPTRHVVITGG